MPRQPNNSKSRPISGVIHILSVFYKVTFPSTSDLWSVERFADPQERSCWWLSNRPAALRGLPSGPLASKPNKNAVASPSQVPVSKPTQPVKKIGRERGACTLGCGIYQIITMRDHSLEDPAVHAKLLTEQAIAKHKKWSLQTRGTS